MITFTSSRNSNKSERDEQAKPQRGRVEFDRYGKAIFLLPPKVVSTSTLRFTSTFDDAEPDDKDETGSLSFLPVGKERSNVHGGRRHALFVQKPQNAGRGRLIEAVRKLVCAVFLVQIWDSCR